MKLANKSSFYTLLAIGLGVLASLISIPYLTESANFVSDCFLRLLKLLSLPVIFLSIVATVGQMETMQNGGRILKKTLKYTILTTLFAAALAYLIYFLIDPATSVTSTYTITNTLPEGSYFSFLKQIIPDNILAPILENNVLATALIAALLSGAIHTLPKENKQVINLFFEGLFKALLKVASWIIKFLPLAIFGFTLQLTQMLTENGSSFTPILSYSACIIGANLVQGFVILPLILKSKGGKPLHLAKGMLPALSTAFFSKSSNATLPLTLKCAETRCGMSNQTSRFTLPLCSVINMNGCAAFILITLFFVLKQSGMPVTLASGLVWIPLATLVAIGNAGVPMGCFFLTSALLVGMGANLETMGLILPLYTLFDMVETALNVWSDSCVTALVDGEVELKHAQKTENVLA